METFYTKNLIGVKYSYYDIYKHKENRLRLGLLMKVNGLRSG